ncbi:hypothetical protein N658DRAFT_514670 [Parathielavia hyrcaniae]|uniref:C2H2-type domain-containing protein n=1 Tax=Parathielavia hyrcaniae TaxID=113614 RepID=A0AAN6Q3Y8_9PEZI|nr:hypothetical protein N658DRAFT_514670 [Parathielavia hyrcaniae]
MSDFPQYLAMYDAADAGAFTSAIRTGHHHHAGGHHGPVTSHYVPCPYEDKVTKDGTTARMVLLFLRELLEQLSAEEQVHQSYNCPMTRCQRTFAAPLHVIQHLLSCPEIPNGEFTCDKCSTSHGFPTNEKEWTHWTGWKPPNSSHGGSVQRKRSLGSKMRELALWKRDSFRKHHPASESHFKSYPATDTRPSTAASEAPSIIFTGRASQPHAAFHEQPGQRPGSDFTSYPKPLLPSGLPAADGSSMFWPSFHPSSSDLPSTVSSIALSSTVDDAPSDRFSQNTSQSTLFTTRPGLDRPRAPTQQSTQDCSRISASPQQYVFPPHAPFNAGLAPVHGQASANSAMRIEEPVSHNQSPLPPTELHSAAPNGHGWWNSKSGIETPRPTPPASGPETGFTLQGRMVGSLSGGVSSGMSSPTSPCTTASPYYPLQSAPTHSTSRALSQESMQNGMAVFGTPGPERSGPSALSLRDDTSQPSASASGQQSPEDPTEDLVCDECQWKPRGVRENLKGYLRKHKNTHKGVRLVCDVPGCVKTFSRLDNLKKHKKEKHSIEDTGGSAVPAKRMAGDEGGSVKEEGEAEPKGADTGGGSDLRAVAEDHTMTLWPSLHC